MNLFDPAWHSVLWDPVNKKMLNNVGLAETILLNGATREARNEAAQIRLNNAVKERSKGTSGEADILM